MVFVFQRALPYPPDETGIKAFRYDPQEAMDQPEILTSCAITETMQELLEHFHEQNLTVKHTEPMQPSSLASVKSSILVMDFNPVRRGSRHHQLQSSFGAPLLPFSPAEKTKDKACSEGRNTGLKEVVCFRTTSNRVGDCKLGSWWKQALETRRASTGLLPAIDQVPAVTEGYTLLHKSNQCLKHMIPLFRGLFRLYSALFFFSFLEKRHSLVLGWPQCHGLIKGCKQEVKKVRKHHFLTGIRNDCALYLSQLM